jgi:hypothetical protein
MTMPTLRRSRVAFAVAAGLTTAASGWLAPNGGRAAAQAPNPCTLVTHEEVQKLVPKEHVEDGVAIANPAIGAMACRYSWGVGVERENLSVSVHSAARAFVGMNADAIKQTLQSAVVPDTAEQAIADVGQAATFKAYSSLYVGASAYVKDRLLQVTLDGIDAIDQKGALIGLLKSAASRL